MLAFALSYDIIENHDSKIIPDGVNPSGNLRRAPT